MNYNLYKDLLPVCDRYIEEHPTEPVTAAKLAALTGYSLSHFSLLFHAYTDMPLSDYVRGFRLRRALQMIADGASITRAALDAGFETNAGFTKAFKKAYGITPSEYKQQSDKDRDFLLPAPASVLLKPQRLMGYRVPGRQFHTAAWQQVDFSALPRYPKDLVSQGEVGIWTDADAKTGEMTYFFGAITDAPLPDGFSELSIPAGYYASFCLSETVWSDDTAVTSQKIAKGWRAIFATWDEWTPRCHGKPDGLRYDERRVPFELYRGSRAMIYVPVR